MRMPMSEAAAIFGSKSFADWKKLRENDSKLQLAIIDRLDGVIKTLAHTR